MDGGKAVERPVSLFYLVSRAAHQTVDAKNLSSIMKAQQINATRPEELMAIVLSSATWLTAQQFAKLYDGNIKNPRSTLNKWKTEGRIFALTFEKKDLFPSYVMSSDGNPLPIVRAILKQFSGKKMPLAIALWFCSSNSWLNGAKPKDILIVHPELVLHSAIMESSAIERST